ncbi:MULTISPECIES: SDR family oxidoreductase [unclassified Streptomyces]|uniref:SDR family oxidoreductase n=1 Tax=unclassified Streptomyces TaxID=2593676 RepID=UPI002473CD0B|nr:MULTISPECIES: SDR family oxidoreductase [unclassified Streptomyces]
MDADWGQPEAAPSRRGSAAAAGPIGRSATPDEIAACAMFLAHESASFVTGSVLVADGGHGLPETWPRPSPVQPGSERSIHVSWRSNRRRCECIARESLACLAVRAPGR